MAATKKKVKSTSEKEQQRGRTGRNKLRRSMKRIRRLEKWLKLGKKKNGKPVLTAEQRVARKATRKTNRLLVKEERRLAQAKARREMDALVSSFRRERNQGGDHAS